ncbi:MAG: hypothetical protein F6K40_11160 [Okeania sp. SIO3I5]|uniref:hypothetical protein n=1 Tax=Okeania sp. SIO3I5 TaxID=2607805 RepID=UPI0013BCB7EE|nr:hypothetical protein [Okeania sp. SIO3I5]NEQ36805.1 hypothetical protein [Okeania sp. SIO3I5]
MAVVTVERFFERVSRLYEQNATASRIEEYARHWLIWVRSGVERVELHLVGEDTISPFAYSHGAMDFLPTSLFCPLHGVPN